MPGPYGTTTLQISNLHDDIVATVDLANPTTGLTGYAETTEYGIARDTETALVGHYAWLGTKQRSTDTVGGLTLMGARLYNPATGLFLSRDPVAGGNDNTYTYPSDPINSTDPDGQWGIPWNKVGNHFKKHWKTYATVASLAVPGGIYARAFMGAFKGYRATQLGRAASAAKAVKSNNALRVGRVSKSANSPRRVSMGPTRKHWEKMKPIDKKLARVHVHVEKKGFSATWHGTNRSHSFRRFR